MTKIAFFDEMARSENLMLFTPDEHRKVRRLKNRLGDLRGARVLEPGCGAGPFTEYLARWVGEDGEVFAFDASPAMAEACGRRMAGRANVRVECAELGRMVLQPGAWDVVVLFRIFPHLEEPERILCELRRALKPGGRLIIANLEDSETLNRWHAQCGEAVHHDYMPSAAEMECLLKRCGYAVLELSDTAEGFLAVAVPQSPMKQA